MLTLAVFGVKGDEKVVVFIQNDHVWSNPLNALNRGGELNNIVEGERRKLSFEEFKMAQRFAGDEGILLTTIVYEYEREEAPWPPKRREDIE